MAPTSQWELYAPPIFPISDTGMKPTLRFDLVHRRLILNADAMTHLESPYLMIEADRKKYDLKIYPISSPKMPCISVLRTGVLRTSPDLMVWLRFDFNSKRKDYGIIELTPMSNHTLSGSYQDAVSRRAARMAKKADDDGAPK